MRKLLILTIMFGLMLALKAFDVLPDTELPEVLVSLGFILLAASTLAAIIQKIGLPQVVGYIFAGVLFGPHFAKMILGPDPSILLFDENVVEALTLINLLAQGLIGLTAGGELKIPDLKKDAKSIAIILGSQTLIVMVAVSASIGLVMNFYPAAMPFLETGSAVTAAALLFGALAVGTSPATTLAVITETRSKGPVSTLSLNLIVSKDITTVTLYLLTMSIAAGIASGEGFHASTLGHIATELGGAIALGLLMGGIIVAYLKWVRAELMLFTVTLVFVGQWIAQQIHAEALLAFMVAGFLVENFSKQGERMIHELERLSTPVFVVFFTIAAAKLELAAIKDYWVIALVYIVVRAVTMFLSTQLGTKLAKSPPVIRQHLWWSFFPQAGVTLTLASLVQGKIEWATEFQTILMSTILVDIIVGPVLFKLGLTQAGEVGQGTGHGHGHGHAEEEGEEENGEDSHAPSTKTASTSKLLPVPSEEEPREHMIPQATFASPNLAHDRLNRHMQRLRTRLARIPAEAEEGYLRDRRETYQSLLQTVEEQITEVLQETITHLEDFSNQARSQTTDALEEAPVWRDRDKLKAMLQHARRELIEDIAHIVITEGTTSAATEPTERLLQEILTKVDKSIQNNESTIIVPQEEALFQTREDDSLYVGGVKSVKRILRPLGVSQTRAVPMSRLARYYIALPMPRELMSTANLIGSQRLYAWRKVRILFQLADHVFTEALEFLEDAPLDLKPLPGESIVEVSPREENDDLPRLDIDLAGLPTSHEIAQIEDALRSESKIKIKAPKQRAVDKLAAFFRERLADLKTDAEHARRDMDTFADDIERRIVLAMVTPYRRMYEALELAGTFELSVNNVTPSDLFEEYKERRVEIMNSVRNWRTLSKGLAGSLALELEIARTEVKLREVLLRTLQNIDRELLSTLSYHTAEFGERITETQGRVEKALVPGANPDEVRRLINRERALLLSFIQDTALPDIQELRESRRFSQLLEVLLQEMRSLAEQGPEFLHIAPQESLDVTEGESIEEIELLKIPLRDVLHEVLEKEVSVQLSDVELRLTGLIERSSAELLEVGRIVGFNLEAAEAELQAPGEAARWQDGEDQSPWKRRSRRFKARAPRRSADGLLTPTGVELPTEFCLGGLARARERLDAFSESLERDGRNIEETLQDETVKPILRVHDLVTNHSPSSLKRFLLQRELTEVSEKAVESTTAIQRVRGKISAFYKKTIKPVHNEVLAELRHDRRDAYHRQGHIASEVAEAISDVWERDDLPEIYRRLFSPSPIELTDFFIPRPEVLQRFKTATRRWLEGQVTTVAIIGETGSGRTSFVNYALQSSLDGMPTLRRTLQRTVTDETMLLEELSVLSGGQDQSLQRLQLRLSNRKDRCVVVVEQAENLFLRSLDGLDILQRFLALISETNQSVLWILSMNQHSWDYLNNATTISDHFTHLLHLRPFTRPELESAIMTRHRVSGYSLEFDKTFTRSGVESRLLRIFKPTQSESANDRQRLYFDSLYEASRGNPMSAIYHWLRSVSQDGGDHNTLQVHPIQIPQLDPINDLDTEKLLALTFIILHQGLTVAEFSKVFRTTEGRARATLINLKHMGILYVDPGAENSYRIHRVLRGQIVRILQNRNMI